MHFRCWKPDDFDEADGQMILADDPRSAAMTYARIRHSYDDYPNEQIIHVRDEHGGVTMWDVETEVVAEFYARPYTKPTPAPSPTAPTSKE